MIQVMKQMLQRAVGDRVRFKDGTEYVLVNTQGTVRRDPPKLRGKARVKRAKRQRHA